VRLAADEAAHRPDFNKMLLESTVYVIGQSDGRSPSVRTTEAVKKSPSKTGCGPTDPGRLLSSLVALRRSIDYDCGFAALPARSLFEITKGSTLILNPRSD
jgi:hypothetical protein